MCDHGGSVTCSSEGASDVVYLPVLQRHNCGHRAVGNAKVKALQCTRQGSSKCWYQLVQCGELISKVVLSRCGSCWEFLFKVLPASELPHEHWMPLEKDTVWVAVKDPKDPLQQPQVVHLVSPDLVPCVESAWASYYPVMPAVSR